MLFDYALTSMDSLQKVINRFQRSRIDQSSKHDFLLLSDILNTDDFDKSAVYYEQIERVINLIEYTTTEITNIYNDVTLEDEEKYKLIYDLKQETINYIGQLRFSKSTMIKLLQICETDKCKAHGWKIINYLFGYPNTSFYEVVYASQSPMQVLEENTYGDIDVYGISFSKIYKNR